MEYPYPMNYGRNYKTGRVFSFIYGMAGLGGVLVSLCIFLPWVKLALSLGLLELALTVDGMGQLNQDLPSLPFEVEKNVNIALKGVLDRLIVGGSGVIPFILAGLIILTAIIGLLFERGALVLLLLGLVTSGFIGYELLIFGSLTKILKLPFISLSVGFGLYAGLLGAILTLLAGLMGLIAHHHTRNF